MIESSEKPTIVYTDHAATVGIVKQTTLNTVSVEKLNLLIVESSSPVEPSDLDPAVCDRLQFLKEMERQPLVDEKDRKNLRGVVHD